LGSVENRPPYQYNLDRPPATVSRLFTVRPSSLAVIGLGAIGGSLAWQARLAGVTRVTGYSSRLADGVQALKATAITELADSPERAVRSAELVVLATPAGATIELVGRLGRALEPGAFLTDVCSIKAPIIKQAVASELGSRFAGSHPLAGTHESGFAGARPDRLRGCVVYICETGVPQGDRAATAIAGFWEKTLEASPVYIQAEAHDRQLGWTSHLPQAIAYALAKTLADQGMGGLSYGSGAKDTTRLAASHPDIWIDILLHNRAAVSEALTQTEARIAELRRLLADGDAQALRSYLDAARAFRSGIER
jgi:prephenate dehydrogenase